MRAAQEEWSEAEAADSTYQQQLAETRTTGARFDTEIQAFRRTLATLFGRRDKDFQKLRTQRAAEKDDEDDAGAPSPPEPVEPASPDAQPPA